MNLCVLMKPVIYIQYLVVIATTVNGESSESSLLRLTETIRGERFTVELKQSYLVHCKLLI